MAANLNAKPAGNSRPVGLIVPYLMFAVKPGNITSSVSIIP